LKIRVTNFNFVKAFDHLLNRRLSFGVIIVFRFSRWLRERETGKTERGEGGEEEGFHFGFPL